MAIPSTLRAAPWAALVCGASACGHDFAELTEQSGPRLQRIAPEQGFNGDRATLVGSAFSTVAAGNQVFFGATPAQVLTVDERGTRLEVEVPVNARSGPVRVSVTTSQGSVESAEPFHVLGPGHPRDERLVGAIEMRPRLRACAVDRVQRRLYVFSPTVEALLEVDYEALRVTGAAALRDGAGKPGGLVDVAVLGGFHGGDSLLFELHGRNPDDPRRGKVSGRHLGGDLSDLGSQGVGRRPARLIAAPEGAPMLAATASAGVLHLLHKPAAGLEALPVPVASDLVDLDFNADGGLLAGVGADGDLVIVDVATRAVTRTPLGRAEDQPVAVAIDDAGQRAAVVFQASEEVVVKTLDDEAAPLLRFRVPRLPSRVRFSADGAHVLVATAGDGRVKAVPLDGPRAGRVSAGVEVGADVICLERVDGGERLLAVSAAEDRVSVLAAEPLSVIGDVEVRSGPHDLALVERGETAVIAFDHIFGAGVFDTGDGALRGRVNTFPEGRPQRVAFREADSLLVLAAGTDRRLIVLRDAGLGINGWSETQRASAAVEVDGTILEMVLGEAADSGVLLLVRLDDGRTALRVSALEAEAPRVRPVAALDGAPVAIAPAPEGGLPVALLDDGSLVEVNPQNATPGRLLMSARLPECPGGLRGCVTGLAVGRDARRAFLTLGAAGRVLVLDLEGREVLAALDVPAADGQPALSPDGRRLYVTGGAASGALTLLDTERVEILLTLAVPAGPRAVRFTRDGARAFVVHTAADHVTLFE